jgi:hypothetical protein
MGAWVCRYGQCQYYNDGSVNGIAGTFATYDECMQNCARTPTPSKGGTVGSGGYGGGGPNELGGGLSGTSTGSQSSGTNGLFGLRLCLVIGCGS